MRNRLDLITLVFMIGVILQSRAPGQNCPTSPVTSFPWVENFDGFTTLNNGVVPPPDWTNDPADATGTNSDWFFRNNSTTSTNTGPTADHTTSVSGQGFYAYIEDSVPGDYPMVNLVTPCLDLSSLSLPQLEFWVHSNDSAAGTNQNFLTVDVIGYPGGFVFSDLIAPPIGHVDNNWNLATVDLSLFVGQTIQIRFRGTSDNSGNNTFTHDIAIDDVVVKEGQVFDVGVTSVDAPVSQTVCGSLLGTMETVTVSIGNFALNPLAAGTPIPVEYRLNGGPPVSEIAIPAAPVAPLTSFQYSFLMPGDFSSAATNVTVTATTMASDPVPANDAASAVVNTGTPLIVNTFPYVENFDNFGAVLQSTIPPPCWIQDTLDATGTGGDPDWYFRNTTTTSGGTGPPADHTTGVVGQGFYAYVEDSSGNHPFVNLVTPQLDLSLTANPALRFWVHSNNSSNPTTTSENFLSIDVIDVATGNVSPDVFGPTGHLGNAWNEQLVSLAQFQGALVQIQFRGSSNGGSSTHDLAIDDIEIFDAPQSNGQPPQAGLAVMDINGATNAAGFTVTPGLPGPYSATVTSGGLFSFEFTGQPNQVIVVLMGPLNVGAAVFPNIGQMDIGGAIDPMTGIPTGITVLADGNNPDNFNVFFRLTPGGIQQISFTLPATPPGLLGAFQAVIYDGSPVIVKLTNAVEVTVM